MRRWEKQKNTLGACSGVAGRSMVRHTMAKEPPMQTPRLCRHSLDCKPMCELLESGPHADPGIRENDEHLDL